MNKRQKAKCRGLLEVMELTDLLALARIIKKQFIQFNRSKKKVFEEAIDAILTTIKTPEEILQRQNMKKEYLALYLKNMKVPVSTKYTAADLRSRILELWGFKKSSADIDPGASTSSDSDTGATSSKKTIVKQEDVYPSPMEAAKKKKMPVNNSDFKEKRSTAPEEKRKYHVSVSFDFGTTFSGYAFSLQDKPNDIITNPSWTKECDMLRTPTCILINQKKEFVAFGYDAETKYSELVDNNLHHGYYFFQRFKMALYDNEISKDMLIEDIYGEKLPALLVFTLAMKYLYDHFWKSFKTLGFKTLKTDVKYVLTVPSIWSDKAKQFMRKACTKAGIQSEQLRMALEPEAASVWCQSNYADSHLSAVGSKYMVIDLGGGTADMTVNEKMQDGTLKELHKASGGPWGDIGIEKAFINFLSQIFSEDIINEFKKTQKGDYFKLLQYFATKKRCINSSSMDKVNLWIPVSLTRLFERHKGITLEKWLKFPKFQDITSPSGDKLRVKKSFAKSWYDETLNQVTRYVVDLLEKPLLDDVQCILLVGGLAECDMVQDAFRLVLGRRKLIVPPDARLFVMKGAVILGHKPELISVRRSKLTYGTSVHTMFDDAIHRQDKKVKRFDKEWCKDVFSKVVSIGDILHQNREFIAERRVMDVAQKTAIVSLFCSDEEDPMYVTDAGCTFLGEIKIDLPQTKTSEDKAHAISLIFWDTEIRVRVEILKTKKTYETTLDSI